MEISQLPYQAIATIAPGMRTETPRQIAMIKTVLNERGGFHRRGSESLRQLHAQPELAGDLVQTESGKNL
jgi:hypothetical protein